MKLKVWRYLRKMCKIKRLDVFRGRYVKLKDRRKLRGVIHHPVIVCFIVHVPK